MLYKRFEPNTPLRPFVECYWVIENNDRTVVQQKIVPDGFPELIFHYAEPYRININGVWETQSPCLLAGQIRNHFFLENTGTSGMIGVKLKPTAVTRLFGIQMDQLTDKVLDAEEAIGDCITRLGKSILGNKNHEQKVAVIETFLSSIEKNEYMGDVVDEAINIMVEHNGMLTISDVLQKLDVGERKLERLFQKYVGISPKFYSRIIRFNYIFSIVQEQSMSWSELALNAGFYDQSHFIKNFQEFTGEDPTEYFFEDENMANFFLHKKNK